MKFVTGPWPTLPQIEALNSSFASLKPYLDISLHSTSGYHSKADS